MNANEIPDFGPDFAERVLTKADGIVARRRHVAAGAFSFALVAVVAWVAVTRSAVPSKTTVPDPVARGFAVTASAQDDQTDALAYLFPDATPVARFAATDPDEAADSGTDNDVLDPLDDGTR